MTSTNKNSENNAADLAKYFSGDRKVFIDTCSMMDDSFPAFMKHAAPLLARNGIRIIVCTSVFKELDRHSRDISRPDRQEAVRRAYHCLLKYRGCFSKRGEKSDAFPDSLFQSLCMKFRMQYDMLFITQDRGLAADLLNINSGISVHGHPVLVRRISADGYLQNPNVECNNGRWEVASGENNSGSRVRVNEKKAAAFRLCSVPRRKTDGKISLTHVPGVSDEVIAAIPDSRKYARLRLTRQIASGGEGCIYETDQQLVAKIYKQEKLTENRRDKILMMTRKHLEYNGIAFPKLPLYNNAHEFVGYLMDKADGTELGRSVFAPFIQKAHPDWKREDLACLCVTILKKIEYLHSMNILIGDINPANILVKSPNEVFFVDTDSYQIEDLPCPVGQVNYTAPELQDRKYYSDFLRTKGNENFAIATLLFQILMLGKLPYARTDGGTPKENIRNMRFPYCLGNNPSRNVPEGQWRYIWSHLSYQIKLDFYHTFQKEGKYSSEETRLSVSDWLKEMKTYYNLLSSHHMAENDWMSEELIPTRLKAAKDDKWATCKHCGQKFPYPAGSARTPQYCDDCWHEVVKEVTCVDCGETFSVTRPWYDSLKSLGYRMPKRCQKCRDKKKMNKWYGGLDFEEDSSQSCSFERPVA